MKILLINPPVPMSYYNKEYYLPSGLMYLASTLINNKDEVNLLDLKIYQKEKTLEWDFFEKKILQTIEDLNPEMIGWGCLFSGNFPDVLRLSELIKNKFPKIIQVLGGIHATIYTKEIIENCPTFDYIILGEGEDSFAKLVNSIKNKGNLEEINGLAFKQNGKSYINAKSSYIKNLDEIPFPAYEIVNIEDYYVDTSNWHNPKKLKFNTSIPIISSRSCPNRCTFCSMWHAMGPMWRSRSPDNVVDEIEFVIKKYGQRHFSFMDDNMSLNKSRTIEICKKIVERNLDIEFETPNGLSIRTLDEEVVNWLSKAGLVRASLAIESGSDYIRNDVMKKNLPKEKIYEVVKIFKKFPHIYLRAFFIMGMPEETKETLEDTYNMIKDLDVDRVYLHNIIPYPGTKVFEQAKRDNLLVDLDIEELYKSDSLYLTNYDRIFIKPYKLTLEELKEFRIKCNNLILKQKSDSI